MLRSHQRSEEARAAEQLYATTMARAREPAFYRRFSVPDTIDGRFDLVVLHAALVLEGMKRAGLNEKLGSPFVTAIFAGFEEALRELGVTDMGLIRRIKAMADAFYGRVEAYAEAMEDEDALGLVILRNLYRGEAAEACAQALARYMRQAIARISAPALNRGEMDFGPVPD